MSTISDAGQVASFAFELRKTQRQVKHFQRSMITNLIETSSDPIEIMNWKRVYEWPLIILRRFHETAGALEKAALKNH